MKRDAARIRADPALHKALLQRAGRPAGRCPSGSARAPGGALRLCIRPNPCRVRPAPPGPTCRAARRPGRRRGGHPRARARRRRAAPPGALRMHESHIHRAGRHAVGGAARRLARRHRPTALAAARHAREPPGERAEQRHGDGEHRRATRRPTASRGRPACARAGGACGRRRRCARARRAAGPRARGSRRRPACRRDAEHVAALLQAHERLPVAVERDRLRGP